MMKKLQSLTSKNTEANTKADTYMPLFTVLRK